MVVSKNWQHCKRRSEQLNCTQFDQLIPRKIIKIVATRCHILKLNAPNLISAGPPPQTPLAELIALPRPPGWISGVWSEGKGRKGREMGNKSPEWLSQKLGSVANATVNS